jgi:hypothetical protein
MKNIQTANWQWTDDFQFFFYNKESLKTEFHPQDVWDMAVINIDTFETSASPEAVAIAGKYRYTVPMYNVFSMSITFRDLEGLQLKDYFMEIWKSQQTKYFDDVKSTIEIYSVGNLIFKSDDVLIDNISQSQFNNSNTQIMEFTVLFTCTSFSTNKIKNFGKKAG